MDEQNILKKRKISEIEKELGDIDQTKLISTALSGITEKEYPAVLKTVSDLRQQLSIINEEKMEIQYKLNKLEQNCLQYSNIFNSQINNIIKFFNNNNIKFDQSKINTNTMRESIDSLFYLVKLMQESKLFETNTEIIEKLKIELNTNIENYNKLNESYNESKATEKELNNSINTLIELIKNTIENLKKLSTPLIDTIKILYKTIVAIGESGYKYYDNLNQYSYWNNLIYTDLYLFKYNIFLFAVLHDNSIDYYKNFVSDAIEKLLTLYYDDIESRDKLITKNYTNLIEIKSEDNNIKNLLEILSKISKSLNGSRQQLLDIQTNKESLISEYINTYEFPIKLLNHIKNNINNINLEKLWEWVKGSFGEHINVNEKNIGIIMITWAKIQILEFIITQLKQKKKEENILSLLNNFNFTLDGEKYINELKLGLNFKAIVCNNSIKIFNALYNKNFDCNNNKDYEEILNELRNVERPPWSNMQLKQQK